MNALPHHPLADIFPTIDGEEFAALAADILAHGLHQRIVLYDGQILDGNRYRACIESGVEPRFETYNGTDPLAYVISLNLKRRHLDESQRAMVAARVANLPMGANQHAPIGATSQDAAADMLNVGRRSVQRAREVIERGVPELVAAVEQGKLSVSVAALAIRQPESRQREAAAAADLGKENSARQIITQGAALDRTSKVEFRANELGKFSVIYADPPWRYEAPEIGGPSRRIENNYPTMALEDVCGLPVHDIAADDAVLFLWATSPKLAESMRVIEAWGFTCKTGMVWAKDKIGCGFWVRNQHEHLLICKRGEMPTPPPAARCSSVVNAPRLAHSAKPHVFYDVIERMYPDCRKIELFSRTRRDGWEVWGNQAGNNQKSERGHEGGSANSWHRHGASGAIAVIDGAGNLIDVEDMPCLKDGQAGRRNVNAALLNHIQKPCSLRIRRIRRRKARGRRYRPVAFGRSRGAIEGVVAAAGIPVTFMHHGSAPSGCCLGAIRTPAAPRQSADGLPTPNSSALSEMMEEPKPA